MRIEATGLTVRYGAAVALDGVSVTLAAGDVLGIVGANGAGKSTLLRCLHGAVRPDGGRVTIDGSPVAGADPAWVARRIGVVPQSCSPRFPHRVDDFVALGRFPHERLDGGGARDDAGAVRRAMEAADVVHLAERTVDRLSGGEFRRVLLAQVLAQEPEALLLDEPLQQLDLRHQLETMEFARAFAGTGARATVAVLHDLGMAARYCDRLLILHEGRVLADGAPSAVLTPDRVREAWGVEAVVRTSDVTGAIEVIPARVAGVPRRA